MIYLNKTDYEIYSEYEQPLKTSYLYDYKRATSSKIDALLSEIYKKYTNEILGNWNCSRCSLNNYKKMGKLYFDSKEYYSKQTTEQQETAQEQPKTIQTDNIPQTTQNKPTAKKKGRPKKK